MALHSLYCADVPLRNCSLTHYIMKKTLKMSASDIKKVNNISKETYVE